MKFKLQKTRNVTVEKDHVLIFDDDGQEIVIWVSDEWEEDPTIIPAIRNAIRLANQGKVEDMKKAIDYDKFHVCSISKKNRGKWN